MAYIRAEDEGLVRAPCRYGIALSDESAGQEFFFLAAALSTTPRGAQPSAYTHIYVCACVCASARAWCVLQRDLERCRIRAFPFFLSFSGIFESRVTHIAPLMGGQFADWIISMEPLRI